MREQEMWGGVGKNVHYSSHNRETSVEAPQAMRSRTAIRSSDTTPGNMPEGVQRAHKGDPAPHVHCSTVHRSPAVESAQVFVTG
jgi:hypothetical protein